MLVLYMRYYQDSGHDTIDAIDSLCEHPYNRSLYRTLRRGVSDQLYTMLSSLLYMRGQITMRGEI